MWLTARSEISKICLKVHLRILGQCWFKPSFESGYLLFSTDRLHVGDLHSTLEFSGKVLSLNLLVLLKDYMMEAYILLLVWGEGTCSLVTPIKASSVGVGVETIGLKVTQIVDCFSEIQVDDEEYEGNNTFKG